MIPGWRRSGPDEVRYIEAMFVGFQWTAPGKIDNSALLFWQDSNQKVLMKRTRSALFNVISRLFNNQ